MKHTITTNVLFQAGSNRAAIDEICDELAFRSDAKFAILKNDEGFYTVNTDAKSPVLRCLVTELDRAGLLN